MPLNMILEIIVVGILALITGAVLVLPFRKKIKSKEQKAIEKIVEDPELILQKLKEGGKMIDLGEELEYSVKELQGKKTLVLEKKKIITKTPRAKVKVKKKGQVKKKKLGVKKVGKKR